MKRRMNLCCRVLGYGVLVMASTACRGTLATEADCGRIFDRIVELELRELGFIDPVLQERKRSELRRFMASDLALCPGRRLAPGASVCVAEAPTAEDLTHRCFR